MKTIAVLALLGLLAVPAMADDMTMDMGHGAGPADEAFAASMERMMKSMDVKTTGDADKDFVGMMIPHHQGAIDMARVELQYGKDPMLRKLAEDIVKAQEQEIAAMRAWQAGHPK